MDPVYAPSDDSYLLLDCLNTYIQSISSTKICMLDMGTGSGVIGLEGAKKGFDVTVVDSNPLAIEHVIQACKNKDLPVTIIHSDLFEQVPVSVFNIITFNTPYLPNDEELHDPALHGGPRGNEIALEFLFQAQEYLASNGVILLLTSTLAHPHDIELFLTHNNFLFEIVGRKKLFFEELLVYKIHK